jgi:hypothetical protein
MLYSYVLIIVINECLKLIWVFGLVIIFMLFLWMYLIFKLLILRNVPFFHWLIILAFEMRIVKKIVWKQPNT